MCKPSMRHYTVLKPQDGHASMQRVEFASTWACVIGSPRSASADGAGWCAGWERGVFLQAGDHPSNTTPPCKAAQVSQKRRLDFVGLSPAAYATANPAFPHAERARPPLENAPATCSGGLGIKSMIQRHDWLDLQKRAAQQDWVEF